MVTRRLLITCIVVIDERISENRLKYFYLKNGKFSRNFIVSLESRQNSVHFEKKDQLHGLNIWEVIDPKKCGHFNG